MLKASAKAVREQQGKPRRKRRSPIQRCQDELIAARMRELDEAIRNNRKSVIITPDPPDVPGCAWCVSQPVSPEHDPYCSASCAVMALADDAGDD